MPGHLPYMAMYIGDYLRDTSHLSMAEHGAYHLILYAYWQNGGPISSDPERLRRIAKADKDEWPSVMATVAEFFTDDGTTWTHKRVESELQKARARSEAAAEKARASWVGRKAPAKPQHSPSSAAAEPQSSPSGAGAKPGDMLDSCSSSSSPSSVPSEGNTPKDSSSHSCPPQAADGGRAEHERRFRDEFWPLVPRKVKPTMALKAWHRHVKPEHVADCIQAVILWAERVKGRDGDKIEYPSTWLNNGWRDEFTNEKPKEGSGNGIKTRADINAERHREAIEFISGRRPIPGGLGDSAGGFDVFSPRPTAPRRAPAPRQLVGAHPGQRADRATGQLVHPCDAPTIDAGDVDPERSPRRLD